MILGLKLRRDQAREWPYHCFAYLKFALSFPTDQAMDLIARNLIANQQMTQGMFKKIVCRLHKRGKGRKHEIYADLKMRAEWYRIETGRGT